MFIKICGTTNEDDALLAVAMGADAVGFVFAPSPRQVAPGLVRDIVRRLPPEILTVGVFRDEAPRRVVDIVQAAGLRGAQLHGHERPEDTQWIKARVPVVLKGFVAGDHHVVDAADHGADAVLVDGASPGSGRVFDWTLAEDVPDGLKLVLAGGLHAGNVGEAIAKVHPWGVDVATGVESAPGHKDARKMREFVSAVRAATPPPHQGLGQAPYDWETELLG